MTLRICQRHGDPIRNATLCRRCIQDLEKDLADLAAYVEDLELALSRQTAAGDQVGGHSEDKPLPFDDLASKAIRDVSRELSRCVDLVARPAERIPAVDEPAAMSRWLHGRIEILRQHPCGVDIAATASRLVRLAERTVDVRPERWYAGPCRPTGKPNECLTEVRGDDGQLRQVEASLYALPDAKTVRCRQCGAEYDVDDRRAWLLAAAEDQLAHAELIGRAAPALGVDITPSAIRGYADRGRIVPHGVDVQGRPLYRVGDVISVAQDVLARRAEKRDARSRHTGFERSA